jgi:hypothetical protein
MLLRKSRHARGRQDVAEGFNNLPLERACRTQLMRKAAIVLLPRRSHSTRPPCTSRAAPRSWAAGMAGDAPLADRLDPSYKN